MPYAALPPAVAEPLGALHALAQLLACVDTEKWDSVGRPGARHMATLIFKLTDETAAAVEDLKRQDPPPP